LIGRETLLKDLLIFPAYTPYTTVEYLFESFDLFLPINGPRRERFLS